MLPWPDPQGARSFPAPLVCSPHCRHPTSLGSGGRPAHPGLPQGERVSAAGMIVAAPPSSNPHSRGGGARHRCTRIAWLLQQGSGRRGPCQLSNLAKASYAASHPKKPPSEPGNSSILFSTARVACYSPTPTGARMGTCGPHARKQASGLLLLLLLLRQPARGGPHGLAVSVCLSVGSTRCMRCMRCGSQGIEAIFRPACGRAYSRTWTQQILGRYADD
jgi:hypothetical protein